MPNWTCETDFVPESNNIAFVPFCETSDCLTWSLLTFPLRRDECAPTPFPAHHLHKKHYLRCLTVTASSLSAFEAGCPTE